MIRRMLMTGLVLAVVGSLSEATAGPLGIGIMVGEPTGISIKSWMAEKHAVDLAAGWSFADETRLHVHVDYLIHIPSPPEINVGGLLLYAGLGGRVKAEEEESRAGVRIPLGVTYLFAKSHLDFFFEVAPLLDLAPDTEFRVNGGMGVRYYLGGRPRSGRM